MQQWRKFEAGKGDLTATTGFPIDSLERIYLKYCGPGRVIRTRAYLYDVLVYLKTYNTNRAGAYLTGRGSFGGLYTKVRRGIIELFERVDELGDAWNHRWDEENHSKEHVFDENHRLCLDAFPILIQKPKREQRLFYSGKYCTHVVKIQALCDFRGNICWIGN